MAVAGVMTLLILGACGSSEPAPTAATPPPTLPPPSTTTTTEASTTTAALTTRGLYDTVSPSLAFIETAVSTGSGVLLDDGWIVTNAHVVWPFDEVRVVFPDGDEHPRVPVVRADVYEDLAVLGPVSTGAPGLTLDPAADYAVGDTVFLVGYPGEVEQFPTPAITQGVISRIRTWDATDMTFLQTDALIAGGQSGGALVSERGELLGVSGLGGFTESNFALVAAAQDLQSRLEALIAGDTPGRFDIHPVEGVGATTEHVAELDSFWHEAIFVANEPAGTEIEITLDSEDHIVDLTDAIGYSLSESEELTSSIRATTEYTEPHFVYVASTTAGPSTVEVTSSVPLGRWTDPDDDRTVASGEMVRAVLDVSGELDVYRIELAAGDTITASVDGLLDSVIWIDRPGNPGDSLAFDDDSGGGLYGTNARVRFTAEAAGEYLIIVSDALFEPGIGYVLTVE